MAFGRFQDFLSGLVSRQRGLFFSSSEAASIEELVEKLMGTVGEVSGIVTARQVLDHYADLDSEGKRAFFASLESDFNADSEQVRAAYQAYELEPSSNNLNRLSIATVPRRDELLKRLNQTPGATHDLVAMRTDLLGLLPENPELAAVDEDFLRLFLSWFGRSFLVLQTINWSTSAAILERIIRYEAVHEIKDWDDLRSRIDPPNRRCFAFFHPALVDEPLIFVEVALSTEIPSTIRSILAGEGAEVIDPGEYRVATFYSISNCQPGLRSVSFGNFLIKQVVQELQSEFPAINTFITLSPIPGFTRWLHREGSEESADLEALRNAVSQVESSEEAVTAQADDVKRAVFNYLFHSKRGQFPSDPVARFHLGNGASVHQLHIAADLSEKGMNQSMGTMVNYLYDLRNIEVNHEAYATEGKIVFNDKLKSLLIK